MNCSASSNSDPIKIIRRILDFINEQKINLAVKILFDCHKADVSLWVYLKDALLSSCVTRRQQYLIATLISVSSKNSLAESCPIIPGLYVFVKD